MLHIHRSEPQRAGTSRRTFLRRAASGAAVVAVGPVLVPVGRFVPPVGAQESVDAGLAAFAASVELVAVAAYEEGVGFLSDDLAPILQTFSGHHAEHAEAWADLAGDRAGGEPNTLLLEALTPAIEGFSTQNEVLRFARDLENQLSVTCLHLLTLIQKTDAATVAATILPVESSHATALSYELQEGLDASFPFGAIESADLTFGLDPAAFPVTAP